MNATLGELLKTWRQRRRISQRELAETAGISQRHLSFLESGRSMPSREMVMRLARRMTMPHRERNALLVAAGFAPVYRERALSDPAMAPVKELVERLLRGYDPYPALAIDRHWTLLMANDTVMMLLEGLAPSLLQPPVNVLRLSLHPEGLAPRIVNFDEWRGHVLQRLEAQLEVSGDETLGAMIAELSSYPAPASSQVSCDPALAAVAIPLVLSHHGRVLRFLSTTTVFGTPLDITLSELAIEAFLPADETTARALASVSTRS